MENPTKLKETLRIKMKEDRKALPQERREEAASQLLSAFENISGLVLSYASFGTELCTEKLNKYLALRKSLVLPRVHGNNLKLFKLDSAPNTSKMLWEPDPKTCEEIPPEKLTHILVPGLAFDSSGFRLGYGSGYYDRFLEKVSIPTIGVGFKEQLLHFPLPKDTRDIPVQSLKLF